jgi:hypothetical protein
MFFQYAIQVNPVKDNRGSQTNRIEQRAEIYLEGSTLDAEVMQCLLAVEAALIHRFLSGKLGPDQRPLLLFVFLPVPGH